jgi:hypothetical protein
LKDAVPYPLDGLILNIVLPLLKTVAGFAEIETLAGKTVTEEFALVEH